MTNYLDPELLRQLIRYDAETGALTWLRRDRRHFTTDRNCNAWNTRYAGKPALAADNGVGYKIGSIFERHFLAHRVGWAIVHGEWPDVIDHINGDPADNRLCNLRSVDWGGNCRNQRRNQRNTSGVVGVGWSAAAKKWLAQIGIGREVKYLGIYDCKSDAIAARKAAEIKYGFHPNHGRAA